MKRRLIVFLLFIVLCLFMSFEKFGINNYIYALKNGQYILNPKTCRTFWGCTPTEASDALENSYWVDGHYQSAIVDADGNLLLTLSEEDREHWKNYINQLIQNRIKMDASEGYQFIVGDDYKSIETHTTKQVYIADGYNMIRISLFCGIMQMLNGEDVNNWYVDVKMVDLETGVVITEITLPEEQLEVNDEDWDRALNSIEIEVQ